MTEIRFYSSQKCRDPSCKGKKQAKVTFVETAGEIDTSTLGRIVSRRTLILQQIRAEREGSGSDSDDSTEIDIDMIRRDS